MALYPNKVDLNVENAPPYAPLESAPPQVAISAGMVQQLPMGNFNPPVGPSSTELTCPQCRCRVQTKVVHRSTTKTHLMCLLLSWSCCCCCLPYCMDSCRNANHFCPMCGTFIGTYQS